MLIAAAATLLIGFVSQVRAGFTADASPLSPILIGQWVCGDAHTLLEFWGMPLFIAILLLSYSREKLSSKRAVD